MVKTLRSHKSGRNHISIIIRCENTKAEKEIAKEMKKAIRLLNRRKEIETSFEMFITTREP